ncbi:MAG: isopenicillin N synthase family oxygenase [Candidatus Obscuribacter sp.]|nr:isopenicillin N synthase family oxygenase [Candidatus Obscuribacter sp.]
MPTISLNLPLVDFAAYIDARLGGHDTAKIEAELSKQIVDASHNVGMFYLTGHGVKRELIEQVMAVNAQFFASTDEQKQAISTRVSTNYRGYGLLKNYRDWREQIHLGLESTVPHGATAEYWRLWGANLWPVTDTEHYKATMLKYFDAVESLSRLTLTLIAKALGKADDFFTSRMLDRPYLLSKPMSYMPQASAPASPKVGVTAHCDWSWLTFLVQDNVGGLEAQDLAGNWHSVEPVSGAFVVNTGELLEIESGGYLRASPHRVINARIDRQRYSVPLFISPALDALILPQPLVEQNHYQNQYIDRDHVHKVIKPGTELTNFVFGESEWQRKAKGHWCWQEHCLQKV